ncbi:MAG: hypothetical protein EA396_08025 [Anaerolineaceae bacterium]|nr:MAG: hypothetical protein EA396_08025 [Anaerolineaceae bacterium]
MRINRRQSRLSFRRRRRGRCLPILTLALTVLLGLVAVSWHWLGDRLPRRALNAPTASLQSAARAFNTGDLDSAIDHAQSVWQADPSRANAEALVMLAQALVYRSYDDYDRAADRQTALTLTTEAYERMPTATDIIAVHAFALHINGQTNAAARLVTRALNQDSSHALALATRSLIYSASGIHQQALREAQIAVIQNGDIEAHRALARSLSNLGRPYDALAAIESAIEQNDKLFALQFERALYAIQAGQFDTATAAYFHILAFDPDNVKARLRMCELSTTLRESETALYYCGEVVERAPTWADGWYRLGREHYLRGDFPQAADALHRCTTLQDIQGAPAESRIVDCWLLKGEVAELRGDCQTLLQTYEDYQRLAVRYNLRQTWTYPPEGPPICADPTQSTDAD